MNKQLLFFMLICLMCLSNGFSQNILGKGAIWTYSIVNGEGGVRGINILHDISKDTLIDGNNYSEITRNINLHFYFGDSISNIKQESIFLREADNKVYQYLGFEKILYDFNLEIGDDLSHLEFNKLHQADITLHNVNSNNENGSERIYQLYKGHYDFNDFTFYFSIRNDRGLANAPLLLNELSDPRGDYHKYRLCKYENNDGEYLTFNEDHCNEIIETLTSNNNLEIEVIEIYPNPSYGEVNININDNALWNLQLINSLGAIVKSDQLQNNENIIDLSLLDSGIYFVILKNKKSGKSVIQKLQIIN